jgi:hypothetical protein
MRTDSHTGAEETQLRERQRSERTAQHRAQQERQNAEAKNAGRTVPARLARCLGLVEREVEGDKTPE